MVRPAHIQTLIDNADEVKRLIGLHVAITGSKPGRRHGVEVLIKSALVLLVACWESFVEDVGTLGFEFLLNEAKTPDIFPASVLTLSAKPLREHSDERKIWDLAGDGWRDVLKGHKNAIVKKYAGKLNTPRPKQVDELIEKLVGLKGISKEWRWQGTSAIQARARLDALITTRGEIAHRVRAGNYVKKEYVVTSATFIQRLAAITSNRISDFVRLRVGKQPWAQMSYKGTH